MSPRIIPPLPKDPRPPAQILAQDGPNVIWQVSGHKDRQLFEWACMLPAVNLMVEQVLGNPHLETKNFKFSVDRLTEIATTPPSNHFQTRQALHVLWSTGLVFRFVGSLKDAGFHEHVHNVDNDPNAAAKFIERLKSAKDNQSRNGIIRRLDLTECKVASCVETWCVWFRDVLNWWYSRKNPGATPLGPLDERTFFGFMPDKDTFLGLFDEDNIFAQEVEKFARQLHKVFNSRESQDALGDPDTRGHAMPLGIDMLVALFDNAKSKSQPIA